MDTTARVVLDVAVRVTAFQLGRWAYGGVYDAVTPAPVDADIGKGLLALGLTVLAAAGWAAWDARRQRFGRLAGTWVATGVLTGSLTAVLASAGGPGATMRLALADLVEIGPFLAALVAVPALLAGGLVATTRAAGAAQVYDPQA